MPEWLPFLYDSPDGRKSALGHHFEYRMPVAGVECARKLQNVEDIPSNEMFTYGIREVEDIREVKTP